MRYGYLVIFKTVLSMNTFYHKYSTMRRLVHFTILLLFVSTGALAQARYWVAPGATGNWSNGANWALTSGGTGGAGAPVSGQTAIFDNNSTANCVMDVTSITVSSLQTTAGYSGTIAPGLTSNLTVGTMTLAGGTFTAPTNFIANNIFRLTGATFNASSGSSAFNNTVNLTSGTFNAAGTITITRGLDVAAATFNPGTSTAIFSGTSSAFVGINGTNPGTLNFYNLEINKTPPAVNFAIASGDIVNVQNNFNLIDGFYRGGGSFLNVGGNFSTGVNSDGIFAGISLNGANPGTMEINAPFILQSGTTFIINKSLQGATIDITTSLPSNTINFSSYLPSIINIQNGTINFPDSDNAIWNCTNFIIGANATVNASSGSMTFNGDFSNSGTFNSNSGTVVFESNVNRSFSVSTSAINGTTSFYNVVLNNTGADGKLDIQLGDRLSVENNLTVQNGYFGVTGGTLTNPSFLAVGGNLILSTSSKAMPVGISLEFIGPNPQAVTLNGASTGHINGNISFIKSGVGPVTLNSPLFLDVVGQTVTFTNGILATTPTNTINFSTNGIFAVGGNNNSHVDGPVLRTGNTSFTFPTGDEGIFAPIHISGAGFNSNITTATYLAQYVRNNPDVLYPIDQQSPLNPPELKISDAEYWILDQQGASVPGPRVWLSYEGSRSGVTDPTTIGVTGWDFPGFWQLIGNGGLQNVAGVSYVSSASTSVSNVSSADPVFTLSTIDEIANPLPVTWLSFTGRYFNGSVDLNWSTSLEVNNEEYTIERSADGQSFTTIGNVAGVGNTTSISRYSFKDSNPLSGSAYYRIKQTDRDGKFSYSDVIRVSNGEVALKGLRLFPNPSSGKMPLTIENGNWSNKKVTITIYNAVGGIVRQEQITFGSDSRAKINVEALQKGSYFITTSINNERQTMQFFIQ